ncbi:MAG TPA: endopeptidase La [Candidatus Pullichristensenella excrementipullorum]|nr:endopeptidase La [Candidatus Pullichristensenella excrementipullorum]
MMTLDVARGRSVAALESALAGDRRLFVVAQRDAGVDAPHLEDMYTVGTVVDIRHVLRMPDDTVRVLVEGECRAILLDVEERGDMQRAEFMPLESDDGAAADENSEAFIRRQAMMRAIRRQALALVKARGEGISSELRAQVSGEKRPDALCDVVAANFLANIADKQAVLECVSIDLRLETLLMALSRDLKISALEEKIHARVREAMDKSNHDYYLREQIHAIQEELGEDEDEELRELRARLRDSKIDGEARERTEKELARLARTSIHAPESAVLETYIETMLDLPWGVKTAGQIDLDRARKVLDRDHYGMREIKDRLLEYLAVVKHKGDLKSPILCLVGPPGVGKTSIARSVARALGRKFTQMSLGGVHDEAEIRGHRRTYVAAMPGRLISAIRQCGTMDPVFLLDEVDKISRDMRGDPSSALLEALDPAQNDHFRDHYLEAPFDLSGVLFITTANTTDTIDRALLDRMEVIEVPSYTLEEKLAIAKRHLLPKQLEAHGLRRSDLKIADGAMRAIIEGYTREAGVRELERVLARVCRRAVLRMQQEKELACVRVRTEDLHALLGAVRYLPKNEAGRTRVGRVNGLAWTSVGGEVMPIEALVLDGKGELKLTGKLGDVMRESAQIALSVARKRMGTFGVAADFLEKHDLHVHVPEGAVPKDGPSAGVALACVILSALANVPARADVAMTGELTLLGDVLPIGGVKEKLLAAYRAGVTEILLPRENGRDLEKIDGSIRAKLHITLLDDVDEAVALILQPGAEVKVAV